MLTAAHGRQRKYCAKQNDENTEQQLLETYHITVSLAVFRTSRSDILVTDPFLAPPFQRCLLLKIQDNFVLGAINLARRQHPMLIIPMIGMVLFLTVIYAITEGAG